MLNGAVIVMEYGIIAALICGASWLIHKSIALLKSSISFILLKIAHNPDKFFSVQEKNNFVRSPYTKLINGLKKRAEQFNRSNSGYSVDVNNMNNSETIIQVKKKLYGVALDYLYDGQAIKVFDTQDREHHKTAYTAKALDGVLYLTDGFKEITDIKALVNQVWKDLVNCH